MDIPEVNSVFWKEGRLKTFDSWSFKISDKCNSERMASAGFYFIGNSSEPDLVECFICGKQLDGWEHDDNPWDEHVKHQSNCLFVNLNKQDEKDWTVDDLYDLYKNFKIKEYMYSLNKNTNLIKDEATQLMSELSSLYKTTRRNKKSSG